MLCGMYPADPNTSIVTIPLPWICNTDILPCGICTLIQPSSGNCRALKNKSYNTILRTRIYNRKRLLLKTKDDVQFVNSDLRMKNLNMFPCPTYSSCVLLLCEFLIGRWKIFLKAPSIRGPSAWYICNGKTLFNIQT